MACPPPGQCHCLLYLEACLQAATYILLVCRIMRLRGRARPYCRVSASAVPSCRSRIRITVFFWGELVKDRLHIG